MSKNQLSSIIEKLEASDSLASAFQTIFDDTKNPNLCANYYEDSWVNVSRLDFIKHVNTVSHYLKNKGVCKGSKVAIISNTRYEWLVADLAILSLGAISVSVYQSLTSSEIAFILFDSEVNFIFAENSEQIKKIEEIVSQNWKIPAIEDRAEKEIHINIKDIITFEDSSSNILNIKEFKNLVKNINNSNLLNFEKIKRDDIASIVYTSGTTGPPKGVIQTHGNHLSNVRQVLESGLVPDKGCLFLFLPLAHSFARLMAYLTYYSSLTLKFPQVSDRTSSKTDNLTLAKDILSSNSEIIPVVPRLLEKIKSKIEQMSTKSTLNGYLLLITINIAQKHLANPSLYSRILYLLTSPIRKKITNRIFGNNLCFCLSGGAKLPTSINYFFDSLGILVLQGYGLTETCVATHACRRNNNKIGSVGPVLSKDIEVKILEDEEIAIRGPNVSKGYLNRPLATKEAWTEDGWFLTGDQGKIDEDGFLYITGRKKEIIVTSGGKKVVPSILEELVLEHKLFSQAVVIGDDRKYCSVIVSINLEELKNLLPNEIINLDTPSPKIISMVNSHLEKINKSLASFESLKKVIISPYEFTVENGLLTPSMKIKRKEVEKRFKDLIDSAYGQNIEEIM